MKNLLKTFFISLTIVGFISLSMPSARAENTDPPRTGEVSLRSVGAGALSFFIWPGLGQAVNSDKGDKVVVHAVLGFTQIYRFWSGYDALVDRKGGYWNGKI